MKMQKNTKYPVLFELRSTLPPIQKIKLVFLRAFAGMLFKRTAEMGQTFIPRQVAYVID